MALRAKIEELQKSNNQRRIVTDSDWPAATESCGPTEAEFAEIKQKYEEQIQTMQFELSKAIGESMEFEDMKKTYIDEIDCLKVNLVATEELYKESVAQQNILKSRNAFLSQEINDNKRQITKLQADNDALKAQNELLNSQVSLSFQCNRDSYLIISVSDRNSWNNSRRTMKLRKILAKRSLMNANKC